VNRRHVVAALIAVALFELVACGQSTHGTATPGTSAGRPATTGGASTTSLQPCDLLTSADASALQLTAQGGPTNFGGARTCEWRKPVDINGQNGFSTRIAIRDSQSLSDITSAGYTVTQDNVGSHQGKQAALDGGGGCLIAIAVSNTSRVDVDISGGTDTASSCQFANQVAKVVEPHLPSGS